MNILSAVHEGNSDAPTWCTDKLTWNFNVTHQCSDSCFTLSRRV